MSSLQARWRLSNEEVARAEAILAAARLLEQLKVLLGNKPALVMCLGQLYFKAGNNEKGKELVDLALEITSQPSALLPNMPS